MKTVITNPVPLPFLILSFALCTLNSELVFSQVPTVQDCLGAIPICQEVYYEQNSYSGSGNYPNEIYNPMGDCTQDCPGSCLDGEQNSVWYIITTHRDGYLRFTIDPAGDDDYDWAVYDLTDHECSDIYYDYNIVQKSCNAYGYPPNGPTGISTAEGGSADCNDCGYGGSDPWNADLYVTEGSTYVIVVENWSGTNDGFIIDFSSSTAIIFDNRPPVLATVLTDELSCSVSEITFVFSERVMCETVDPSDFLLSGPNGPVSILDVQGEACMIGGEMERQFTLILDSPPVSSGEYILQLVPGNDVTDACNNLAGPDTLAIYLDLGSPIVVDTAIVITPANYGVNNGQITGLIVSGYEPLSYRWYDHINDTVGTELDLHDVYSGDYYLEIVDTNGCEAHAGPYFIDLVADVNETQQNHAGTICVFPNPSRGEFTVQLSPDVTGIEVVSLIGNIIRSYKKEEFRTGILLINLTGNGPGIYLIKAISGNGEVLSHRVQVF